MAAIPINRTEDGNIVYNFKQEKVRRYPIEDIKPYLTMVDRITNRTEHNLDQHNTDEYMIRSAGRK